MIQISRHLSALRHMRPVKAGAFDQRNAPRGERASFLAEPLEGRVMLTSVVVNTAADVIDPPGSSVVSLRDAAVAANTSSTPTTITFDPGVFATAQTITLNGTQLELSNAAHTTTIKGPAAGITISGNKISRVFQVDYGVTAVISAVSIVDGLVFDASGAGVLNFGVLSMQNCSVDGNSATGTNGGGGIMNLGTIDLTDVDVSGNTAGGHGGGIENYGKGGDAIANLVNVTLSGNTAGPHGAGVLGGGGIASDVNGGDGLTTLNLTNVTVTGNSSPEFGGGILLDSSNTNTTFQDVTVVRNNSVYGGGGIVNDGGDATFGNSIVAVNSISDLSDYGPDVYGSVASAGNNLVGDADGSAGWISSDLIGSASSPINPQLGTLANNGGSLETMLPLTGSPAIDAGSNALVPAGISLDETGSARIRNGTVDIGAVEVQNGPTTPLQAGTITLLSSSAPGTVAGDPLTFTASVSAQFGGVLPTGSVTFFDGSTAIGTTTLQSDGTVTLTISDLAAGQHVIDATYAGDANYTGSQALSPVDVNILPTVTPSPVLPVFTRLIFPTSIVFGARISISFSFSVTNTGGTVTGSFSAAIFVDASSTFDGNQISVMATGRRLALKNGRKAAFNFHLRSLPESVTAGDYYFIAQITDPTGAVSTTVSPRTIQVASPFVALTASTTPFHPSVFGSKPFSFYITVTVKNTGNTAAIGTIYFDTLPYNTAHPLGSNYETGVFHFAANIRPGTLRRFVLRARYAPGAFTAGTYNTYFIATLDGATAIAISPQWVAT